MKILKVLLPIAAVFSISACATMMGEKEPEGISATDCFSSGGTIDTSSGTSMCMMGEDGQKPIL